MQLEFWLTESNMATLVFHVSFSTVTFSGRILVLTAIKGKMWLSCIHARSQQESAALRVNVRCCLILDESACKRSDCVWRHLFLDLAEVPPLPLIRMVSRALNLEIAEVSIDSFDLQANNEPLPVLESGTTPDGNISESRTYASVELDLFLEENVERQPATTELNNLQKKQASYVFISS